MQAEIEKQTNDTLIINWVDESKGFGQLTMKWDNKTQQFILDSECMGIETVIKIFKSIK